MRSTAWGKCGQGRRRGSTSRITRFAATNWGIDFGDHHATRALCAPQRLPACAAVTPPRPRTRKTASLHAGLLAFGVPPRAERPPQAGRGMGMPRPALSGSLTAGGAVPRHSARGRVGALSGCSANATRPGLHKGNPPWQNRQVRHSGALSVTRITITTVHRRRRRAGT